MTDELALQRMIRLSEEAEKYEARLLEMAAKMKLFRKANGRDAETEDILNVWVFFKWVSTNLVSKNTKATRILNSAHTCEQKNISIRAI